MSHFSAIGLSATREEFGDLMDRVIDGAVEDAPAVAPARHLRWTDVSGASVAVHLSDARSVACVTPYFAAPEPTRWRVRTTAPADDADCPHCGGADCDLVDDAGELVTRATVQWLQFQPYRAWLAGPRAFTLQVVAFAHRAGFYASDEAFRAAQESWWPGIGTLRTPDGKPMSIGERSFFPEGMFGSGGDLSARATAMFAGRVAAARRLTNGLSKQPFCHVRVDTLPGAVDVVVAEPEGTPEPGGLCVVRGWLVGRPDEPPPPVVARGGWLRRVFGR
jgi:hypothetical protein